MDDPIKLLFDLLKVSQEDIKQILVKLQDIYTKHNEYEKKLDSVSSKFCDKIDKLSDVIYGKDDDPSLAEKIRNLNQITKTIKTELDELKQDKEEDLEETLLRLRKKIERRKTFINEHKWKFIILLFGSITSVIIILIEKFL